MRTLHIDCISFEENGQTIAIAPQLELCFNSPEKEKSLEYLKDGSKALIEYWSSKNMLNDKIKSLGLNGATTEEERANMEKNVSVPYFILNKEITKGKFDLDIE